MTAQSGGDRRLIITTRPSTYQEGSRSELRDAQTAAAYERVSQLRPDLGVNAIRTENVISSDGTRLSTWVDLDLIPPQTVMEPFFEEVGRVLGDARQTRK